ncbi:uncharacterized protein SCDLUD_002874 [Saccharomycodes ludwigii]|uniref:uncharacterized protein n=1 Tax=Saccharomycodes ludwigii TaxID=36035 RepID=UPI001E86ACC9|nr:hypothetical protein SCDLUD_002874 [Saccharomycodes ludwigii]KAH3901382.1 hypothetical protein SCDLUD_002874 [Saccharomycodes ludwigii]
MPIRPEFEQELAHVLLIELLSFQLASPVRWIETQDVFLQNLGSERIIEIGPSSILTNMTKRTIANKYESFDAASVLKREVLCHSVDYDAIYYNDEPLLKSEEMLREHGDHATALVKPTAPASPAPSAGTNKSVAQPIFDVPVEPKFIVHTLVAQKLKKPLNQISMLCCIKDLVGGKSTIQNEILGDLSCEFGNIPERLEDIPLNEVAEYIKENNAPSNKLGVKTSSLISRLVSSKMSGGFSITVIRKYLSTRWGFSTGRQDSVLLTALTNEPKIRLSVEKDAKLFWDDMVKHYASASGIKLDNIIIAAEPSGGSSSCTIDVATLENLFMDQKQLTQRQLALLANYLKLDLKIADKELLKNKESFEQVQAHLDCLTEEFGEYFLKGVSPYFSRKKARKFDSSWNWAKQDLLALYFKVIHHGLGAFNEELVNDTINFINKSNAFTLKIMEYLYYNIDDKRGKNYGYAKSFISKLLEKCRIHCNLSPVFKSVTLFTDPNTFVDANGNIIYKEIRRNVIELFPQDLETTIATFKADSEVIESPGKMNRIHRIIEMEASRQMFLEENKDPEPIFDFDNDFLCVDFINSVCESPIETLVDSALSSSIPLKQNSFFSLKRKDKSGEWLNDNDLTILYFDALQKALAEGVTFDNKYVLITGASVDSIGTYILQGLLQGGAKVIATTYSFDRKKTKYFQSLYTKWGSKGSALVLVPFNQGSKQDCENLIKYIYDDVKKGGLGWDLDVIIPFAAISETNVELENINSKSEFAHRIMMTNILRMLGCIKREKRSRNVDTRPAQVILPLSSNCDTLGGNGLCSESKLALEALFSKWHTENWSSELSICGAIIGWTRDADSTSPNNIIAEGLENRGIATYSQVEMAFNLLGLLAPDIALACQNYPIVADLTSGLQNINNLKEVTTQLHSDLYEISSIRKAISEETFIEKRVTTGKEIDTCHPNFEVSPKSNINLGFPALKSYNEIKKLSPHLEGLLNLNKVVVITGFAEVGPWGSSRTRWEMEAYGKFSLEGCIEMAWMMGLIKYFSGNIEGVPYTGWVDSKSNEPVKDNDVKSKYEAHILDHTGIRLIEPELCNGYDPNKKHLIQEVVVQHNLEPFETSKEAALQFKQEHGDKVDIFEIQETGEYSVRLLKGSVLYIPKALKFDRLVSGQVPTGWDPKTYGISEDIISQVDKVTLFVLVSVAETFISSGITDPYEVYKYVHVSEVGNCSGSCLGGDWALHRMYKDRFKDESFQNDILQESFINTMSAWVNMLLISSSGPIKTPVGACATAVESLDIGHETILSGKAKICIVGGYEGFIEESSFEFGKMKATSNSIDEFECGRSPAEMSRPATSTRNGFVESDGSGIQLLMTAELALSMGVPIYGILAFTATASDKIGKSVPAPGKGILTTSKEHNSIFMPKITNIKYRKSQLKSIKEQAKLWAIAEIEALSDEVLFVPEVQRTQYVVERIAEIENQVDYQIKCAQDQWGNEFYKNNPCIAPIRGALAVYDLSVDDIDVASFHGTSTKANDTNESATVNSMMEHLGRSEGNPVIGVFQKYLTGHPKGAAGAWMTNGALQILNSGIIPGNRNADNIDSAMEQYKYVAYPSHSIKTDGVKAVSITCFGFGQKGAQAIVINPDYLYASVTEHLYEDYKTKLKKRERVAQQYFSKGMINNSLFVAKEKAPYPDTLQEKVYLNPLARVTLNEDNELIFEEQTVGNDQDYDSKNASQTTKMVSDLINATKGQYHKPFEVYIELVNKDLDIFNDLNLLLTEFTTEEINYCKKQPDQRASFAGTKAAKMAIMKKLNIQCNKEYLKQIEIDRGLDLTPKVKLYSYIKDMVTKMGISSINVSIINKELQAIAFISY